MKRAAKRNYTLMTFMAVLITVRSLDRFLSNGNGQFVERTCNTGLARFRHPERSLLGMMIFFVSRSLASKPLIAKHHPFFEREYYTPGLII
jgi:hypothetical protein